MGADAATVLAALAGAGNDLDALAAAIRGASFLDTTPGEDRQKLRGAQTRSSPSLWVCLGLQGAGTQAPTSVTLL